MAAAIMPDPRLIGMIRAGHGRRETKPTSGYPWTFCSNVGKLRAGIDHTAPQSSAINECAINE
ncbi:MAG: hypothetical protein ABSH33_13010 [Steroidobacteraceae bacterium]|jgi:hypothetical protein